MNRTLMGGLAALLLVASGIFWWQGRAATERGAPPPDLGSALDGDPELPEAGAHGRGAGLPEFAKAERTKMSKEQRRFNRYDKNKDGTITRPEMLSTRVTAFKKLDNNHDNLLSFEEWAIKTSNRFREVDRNGDGVVSHDEMNAYYAAQDAKPKRASCACGAAVTRRAAPPQDGSEGEGGDPGQ